MKLTFKIDYNKFVDKLFFIYICFFYAFPYQMLKVELVLLILLFPKLKKIKINAFLGWSIAYIIVLLLSIIYSVESNYSTVKTFQVLKSLIFTNIFILYMNSEEKIEKIFKYFIISGFILIFRIILVFPIDKLGKVKIYTGTLFNANEIGFKLLISLLFILYFIFIKKNKSIFFIFGLIILCVFLISTGSRTVFAIGIFEIFSLFLFSRKNKKELIFFLFITIIITYIFLEKFLRIPVIYNILGQRIETLLNVFTGKGKVDNSSIVRINMIKDGIKLFLEKPFLGYGIDTYKFLTPYKMYSHNNYIELLVGMGILGTIVYYFIYIFIFIKIILKKREELLIFNILILVNLIIDLTTVTYYDRSNIFIIAFSFLGVIILKERKK